MKRLQVPAVFVLLVGLGCGDGSGPSTSATNGPGENPPPLESRLIVDDEGNPLDGEVHYYDLGESEELPPEVLTFMDEYGLSEDPGGRSGALTMIECAALLEKEEGGAACVEDIQIQMGAQPGVCPSTPCLFAFMINAESKPGHLLSDACMWRFPGIPPHTAHRIVIWGTFALGCGSSQQATLSADGQAAAKLKFLCLQCTGDPPPY